MVATYLRRLMSCFLFIHLFMIGACQKGDPCDGLIVSSEGIQAVTQYIDSGNTAGKPIVLYMTTSSYCADRNRDTVRESMYRIKHFLKSNLSKDNAREILGKVDKTKHCKVELSSTDFPKYKLRSQMSEVEPEDADAWNDLSKHKPYSNYYMGISIPVTNKAGTVAFFEITKSWGPLAGGGWMVIMLYTDGQWKTAFKEQTLKS